jgi:hypothetical protein
MQRSSLVSRIQPEVSEKKVAERAGSAPEWIKEPKNRLFFDPPQGGTHPPARQCIHVVGTPHPAKNQSRQDFLCATDATKAAFLTGAARRSRMNSLRIFAV